MARLLSSNYTAAGTQFQWADVDSEHPMFPEDLGRLAAAFEAHNHVDTRGLAVGRVADLSIHAAAYQATSIATSKLQDDAVTGPKIADAAISNPHLNGQMVDGVANVIPASILAASLGVLTGNPAIRLGPLGHASYGSIRWDGDGGVGTYLYDAISPGDPRHIVQARGDKVYMLSANGSSWATLYVGGLQIQPSFAVSLHSPLTTGSNAALTLEDASILTIKKLPTDDATMISTAGLQLITTGKPAIGFTRTGQSAGSLFWDSNNFWKRIAATSYKMWDANNMGAGSLMDADLLDGLEAVAFSLAGHSHGSFMPLAGGTFSGLVTFGAGATMTGGQMTLPGGSAGAPSLKIGSGNQGLYESGGNEFGFVTQGTQRGVVKDTGVLHWNTSMEATAFNPTSDRRTKENFLPAPPKSLRFVPIWTYNRIGEKDRNIGVMAQDLKEIIPLAVKNNADGKLSVDLLGYASSILQYAQDIDHRFEQYQAMHP